MCTERKSCQSVDKLRPTDSSLIWRMTKMACTMQSQSRVICTYRPAYSTIGIRLRFNNMRACANIITSTCRSAFYYGWLRTLLEMPYPHRHRPAYVNIRRKVRAPVGYCGPFVSPCSICLPTVYDSPMHITFSPACLRLCVIFRQCAYFRGDLRRRTQTDAYTFANTHAHIAFDRCTCALRA